MAKKSNETTEEVSSEAEAAAATAEDGKSDDKKSVNRHDRLSKVMASATMAAIQKEHGKGIIRKASEHRASITKFIPSGVFPLDNALGGGWRVGAIHTLWGSKSGGKTTTLLKTIGVAQTMCSNCWGFPELADPKTGEVYKTPKCVCGKYRDVVAAYIDVESTWDDEWAKRQGINTDKILLCVPEYAEQTLDIAEGLLRSGDIDILAIDSLAFLTPEKEIREANEKILMGEQPRVVSKGVRKFVAALNAAGNRDERRPTLFFTNQIRMKLGVMFGSPEVQPSGQAPQFASTTEVKFMGGKYERNKEFKEDEIIGGVSMDSPIMVTLPFRVEKSKQGTPKLDGSYKMMLRDSETKRKGEVLDEDELFEQAEHYGIIKKVGSKWDCCGSMFETKGALENALATVPGFKRALAHRAISMRHE